MKINYIDYSIKTQSLDIFFSGCNNHCIDCYNPDLMSFDNGTDYFRWLPKIKHYLKENTKLIKRIFLVLLNISFRFSTEDIDIVLLYMLHQDNLKQ